MSLLPFPSFLDDVRDKGLKKAIFEGIDETVERITAGMNVGDIRSALRGDVMRKPDPRLRPHADGFWLHMRPGYFHKDMTGVYPTFRLGWLSTYFVFFETLTGVLLMFWYTPSPEIAYGDMQNILSNVPLGQFVRDLHRLGAEAMVLIVALHMMRTWVTGSYKKPRQFTWFTGVLLLVITGLLSFTGYLLPWDQLAWWAVTIGASMAEATPVIGEQVNLIVRGAPELGANGLLRFYMAHVLLLPILLFVFTGVHYYKVIIHGHSLPPRLENIGEDTAKRVPLDKRVYFIPDIWTNEIMWVGVTTFILVVLCVWFYHAPLENHADPQNTPLGTTAPWYFLWIQGALKLGDKFFWGILFPTVFIGIFAAMPYVEVGKSRRFAHRRLSLSLAMVTVSFMTVLSYMGLPEFAVATSAETEILHELTMEPAHSHVGPLRTVPFSQAVAGAYTTEQIGAEDPRAAVAAFNEEVQTTMRYDEAKSEESLVFTSEFDLIETRLQTTDHAPDVPDVFRVVPDDAPELLHILEMFEHDLKENEGELVNATGIIVINDIQANLKRIDLLIAWDAVTIETGEIVKDANGNPVPLFVTDDEGNQVLDANGQPIPIRRYYSRHIYLHADSAYFMH
jgi:quinol-cytochrome oxidoreductase complex cytochrome b subunit